MVLGQPHPPVMTVVLPVFPRVRRRGRNSRWLGEEGGYPRDFRGGIGVGLGWVGGIDCMGRDRPAEIYALRY
jgi:hypothetical protein